MPRRIDDHPDASRDCHTANSCDVGILLLILSSDTDRLRFRRHSWIPDVDVVNPCRKIASSGISQGNIIATGRIIEKCLVTFTGVITAARIGKKRLNPTYGVVTSG